MIADCSALVSAPRREADRNTCLKAVLSAGHRRMSTANALEAAIVVEAWGGAEAGHELDDFLEIAQIQPSTETPEQLNGARRVLRRFGKGRHPLALSFGDCPAYALAGITDEPLLHKGSGFALTDIPPALPPS